MPAAWWMKSSGAKLNPLNMSSRPRTYGPAGGCEEKGSDPESYPDFTLIFTVIPFQFQALCLSWAVYAAILTFFCHLPREGPP